MKLNADIVYTWLCKAVSASISGPRQTDLCLMRPEFLEPDTERLHADHLYVCLPEQLPRRVDIETGCVLVCAGGSARLRHFEQRCCVIRVHGDADLFHVFNCVQAIFNTFSAWEAGLHRTLAETGDIAELLEASVPIFDAQIQAIDANFHFLGVAWPRGAEVISNPSSEGDLTVDALRQFLQESDSAMMRTGVVPIDIGSICTLNVNLLDGSKYRGCVTLMSEGIGFRPCDGPLLSYLAGFVLRAVNGLTLAGSGDSSIRTSLHDLVEGMPVSIKSQEELRAVSRSRTFVCASIALPRQLDTFSPRYICSQIEGSFSRCWAFEHHRNSLVAILEVPGSAPSESLLGTISNTLRPIIDLGGSSMGISNPFDDLVYIRVHFGEAQAALRWGAARDPEARLYAFADYRLDELLANAPGELPVDSFVGPGLQALIEHDRDAAVSYVETLRCYLRNNCGMSAAARELYLHRSTLVERMDRIFGLLGSRLEDPDERLLVTLCLRLFESEQTLS